MRIAFFLVAALFAKLSVAQTIVESKANGSLEFVELDHGLAKEAGDGKDDVQANTPAGVHTWLKDFEIIKATDSIPAQLKSHFGVVYMVKARDTVEIEVVIEWIYPQKIRNEKGEQFKKIKYSTKRPTNIPSASAYSLDAPFEVVKGDWTINLYIENKKVYTRTFFLY